MERTITPKTKALVVNTPHNPVGKVFTREELVEIGSALELTQCAQD